ncbi:hypothetical protein LVJ83_07110 [Uruburuella testudinis]|uniref:DUF1871 family protein n=1 Tax=Uruburuella testudinis TaxID=1282863 RepID=A0ABY4DPU8_9NEIS|nr:hypothetical protein [Uruburuella testudinis]UOO80759.1 hypothetical protein LVJ83_07110 [Uruburuella testudinis]
MKNILNEINSILFNHWDPIMINENPQLKDEYLTYAKKILTLLHANASEEEIFQLLTEIEENDLGLETDKNIKKSVSNKIFLLAEF